MYKIIANAKTVNEVKSNMSPTDLKWFDETDTPELINAVLEQVFGVNSYMVEHWEGFEVCFINDEGHSITVNEKTLEVYEY